MTLRGGSSPRDGNPVRSDTGTSRVRQAHRIDEVAIEDDHFARPPAPLDRDPGRPAGSNGRREPRRGGGLGGLIRFVLFIVVLAGVVLIASLTVLRPVIAHAVVDYASKNPSALKLPFVADLVREDLGSALTDAPSSSSTQVTFDVVDGDTAQTIATRLQGDGLLKDARALVFIATEQNLTTSLESGTYILRMNMTPQQIVTSLLVSHQVAVSIALRPSLRLEQITAKLQTVTGLSMDVQAFYNEVKHPPAALLADYPWLTPILPEGASLEGFLAAATYVVSPDITADEFVRQLLDTWYQQVGPDLLKVPAARGLTFYQVLSLASVVERETGDDADRAKIAGVYQNRLNPKLFPLGAFQSDPTVFYVNDTLQLAKLSFDQWQQYLFWAPLEKGTTLPANLPADLAGYNTYTSKGMIPGPICTPSVESIKAALDPDLKGGYLYFLATKSGTTVFEKTYEQHLADVAKYGS
ncbi:MAG TPA: endolytic transglycosylase MltG [Candidatus Limnocylindrales bacterium]